MARVTLIEYGEARVVRFFIRAESYASATKVLESKLETGRYARWWKIEDVSLTEDVILI